MKKIITVFAILILACITVPMASSRVQEVQLDVRDYDAIELPAGTFIGVESMQEISTQYCQNGYKVAFITTNDLYMHDTNVIPQDTTFIGYVVDVHDPIVGTNASFRVQISKMILPDGYEIPLNAYIYSSNGNMIGGEMTEPAEWRKMPHYQWNIGNKNTLQIRPGRARKKGSHAIILAGEDRIIVLVEPLMITHTLTD